MEFRSHGLEIVTGSGDQGRLEVNDEVLPRPSDRAATPPTPPTRSFLTTGEATIVAVTPDGDGYRADICLWVSLR